MQAFLFPGQGSQAKGMGREFFDTPLYPEDLARQIDDVLGYSLKQMCLEGSETDLKRTEITQPCLFVVNALHFLQRQTAGAQPAWLAGHSLGEYNALHAAGVFDLVTGVKLVRRRGELMAAAPNGAMAAVLGLDADQVSRALIAEGLTAIDIANFNTPTQVVVSGPVADLQRLEAAMRAAGAAGVIPLQVSAPFHSRYMAAAAKQFGRALAEIRFEPPKTPVISNVTARPYPTDDPSAIPELLERQICSQVQWCPTIGYLKARGATDFHEVGPGVILTRMLAQIPAMAPAEAATAAPALPAAQVSQVAAAVVAEPSESLSPARTTMPPASRDAPPPAPRSSAPAVTPDRLGNPTFLSTYGVRWAYVAGAMYKGIASVDLVVAMARAKLLSFFGAGGLEVAEVDEAIGRIKAQLRADEPFGVNLLSNPEDPSQEEALIDVYLRHGVRNVEASAYISPSPALLRYRLSGLEIGSDGAPVRRHRVIAKVSRPEVAAAFMRPAPGAIVDDLLKRGHISQIQADLARQTPIADDICVESDSGGHTDGGVALALFPAILLLKDQICGEYALDPGLRVGAAGGIGTPHAAGAAFMMGADFIVTGSINQCTREAGTSEAAKALLQALEAQDTAYAPAGDMFEYGSKVQVARRGLFFHTRANKLYELYSRHDSLDELDAKTRAQLEQKILGHPIDAVWREVLDYKRQRGRPLIESEIKPKAKMALVFKWYFALSARLAQQGSEERRVDYQIHCGPALGAFNQWVKGTPIEDWRARGVADIAERLMQQTAGFLETRLGALRPSTPDLEPARRVLTPS